MVITTASIRKVKNKLYHYTYIPIEIAQALGLGQNSRLMWVLNGKMATVVKIPEEEIQAIIKKNSRQKKK